ncbi:DNA-binding response regulator [Desulfosarcina alkanivorans]|uniref:DNA-binding response regulator n=1 Tax=Desulfosarcina alkanivorans TaxID=571177 RepID=A0A5K7YFT5_9BACT|nr:response regulator transcription factor [Desulfosarcina alkanivorans]BBO67906.1 DNA-binding response regulator [Desulfosarcina alkanivorans]
MDQTSVLLITGSAHLHSTLKRLLEREHVLFRHAGQWDERCLPSEAAPPHMIVLECPGSGVDGLSICQEIRSRYSGLLGLVADDEDERFHILALDLGADATFSKTTGTPLVAARIRALLRRFAPSTSPRVLTFGRLTVDANHRDVYVSGQAVNLTSHEFQVIWYLACKPGCVVSRDEIYRDLRNAAYNEYDRSIDVYVSRIRQKIGDLPSSSSYLKTVRGIGYQFVDAEK